MQKLLRKSPLGVLLVLAMSASMASAQVDVELAFNPNVASPRDEVTFFSSIAHMGSEAAVADIELSISFGEFSSGVIAGQMPLAGTLAPPYRHTEQGGHQQQRRCQTADDAHHRQLPEPCVGRHLR